MDRYFALEELLLTLLPTSAELGAAVLREPGGADLATYLTEPSSARNRASELVRLLRSRGLIDADYFSRLKAAHRRNRRRIGEVEALFPSDGLRMPPRRAPRTGPHPRPARGNPPRNVSEFARDDHAYGFYPLGISKAIFRQPRLIRTFAERLFDGEILQRQRRILPAKARGHVRCTVQLDPIAAWLLYDVVFRNRGAFQPREARRLAFGNVFVDNQPVRGNVAYSQFREATSGFADQFAHQLRFDVANYFNHISTTDLLDWLQRRGLSAHDVDKVRLVLAAVSPETGIGALPHGYYPAKVIGSGYLSFLDESHELRTARSVRFMDDVVLFDDSKRALLRDFTSAQSLLSDHGLAVNPNKTALPDEEDSRVPRVEEWKAELLRLRRGVTDDVSGFDDEEDEEREVETPLSADQRQRLVELSQDEEVSEEDAELVLTLLQPYADDLSERILGLVGVYPNLSKRMHAFCRRIGDREALAERLLEHIENADYLGEYELFWLGAIVDDYLLETDAAEDLCQRLLNAPDATDVSRARILQANDGRFGLPEARESTLRGGDSDWSTWSAAWAMKGEPGGSRKVEKTLSDDSSMNRLIRDLVKKLPRSAQPKPPAPPSAARAPPARRRTG